jgi:hypothetical protein
VPAVPPKIGRRDCRAVQGRPGTGDTWALVSDARTLPGVRLIPDEGGPAIHLLLTTPGKRTLVAAALLGLTVTLTACGGGPHAPITSPARADVARSPCRGVFPWRGPALRGCRGLVARWAPVHSMRLTTRLDPRIRSTCEQARRLRLPAVCPPLVPTGGVVADPGLYGFQGPTLPDRTGDFYLLTFNNGDNSGHVHWIVGAGLGRTVERELFDARVWVVPGRIRRFGQRRYGPWRITFYRFPPYPSGGELGGHDLATAATGGTTYFASVHGRTHHDASAAMLIAILLTARAAP